MTRTILLLLAAALALVACGEEEATVEATGKPVYITEVYVRDLEERIEASGELLARNRADVAAQVAGEVTRILDEGEAVEEDGVVVEIDPERRHLDLDRARARVAEARAALAEQKREVERMRALKERNVASETQLDAAETALQAALSRLSVAKADLGTAERALRDATVTARFAGQIAQRYVQPGEFVNVGQPLFELVSLDPVEVEFTLPEEDTARVRVGIPIEVTVSPYPDEVFDATVHIVSPTIDRRTRTLRVRALVPNPDHRLRPGLFARANLGISKREGVVMVPQEALLQRADGAVVFKVGDNKRVTRILVDTGTVRDGAVEVLRGLYPGDRVVARGHEDLIEGSVVVARNPDGSLLAKDAAPGDAASLENGVAAQ
ncbi:MAG: efflux RND transporter periplasmic adaptor subunit [Myxococcota bacterium]